MALTPAAPRTGTNINFVEVLRDGSNKFQAIPPDQFLDSLSYRVSARDVKLLLKNSQSGHKPHSVTTLLRQCYQGLIIEVEHLSLLVLHDSCLVFRPEEKPVSRFIFDFSRRLKTIADTPFTQFVLEFVLEEIVRKFNRHVEVITPAFEQLLTELEHNPETEGLRRLLAVKKSLVEFDQRVEQVRKTVDGLESNTKTEHRAKLFFESVLIDLEEVDMKMKIIGDQADDTHEFIVVHQDSVRNQFMLLSVFIEAGVIAATTGAVLSAMFGMNLDNGIQEHPQAFLIVTLGILLIMAGFLFGIFYKLTKLSADTSSAHSYKLVKNFFNYVDELEFHVFNKKTLNREEFRLAVEKVTKLEISEKESEYLFAMMDTNQDGKIDTETELMITRRTEETSRMDRFRNSFKI